MKIKSVFLLTLCLLFAHSIVHLTEASAGLQIGPTSLAFQAAAGGQTDTESITVYNTGSTALSVTWSDSISWLTEVKPGLTITVNSGSKNTFYITASSANLTAGTYYGTAVISGGSSSLKVPVSLTVSSSTTPVIGLSPSSLTFNGVVGGTNPTAQTLNITNTGGGTLTWSASSNAAWLTLSKTSGTGSASVTVSVKTTYLAAGSYVGTITVSATGATTKSIPVYLNLTTSTTSTTGSATLGWVASTSTSVVGYKVYMRTASGTYSTPMAILGNVLSYIASGLQKSTTYYFVVTSYDTSGKESIHSNEVYKTVN